MAELAVRYSYRNQLVALTFMSVRFLFPIWGIIAPLVVLSALAMFPLGGATGMSALTLILVGLSVLLIGIRLSRAGENNFLIADKTSIEIPDCNLLGFTSRRVSWTAIDKISVTFHGPEKTLDSAVLSFFERDQQHADLFCSKLNHGELEQLLLGIQLWARPEAVDASVSELQELVKSRLLNGGQKSADPSYTALWEEELRRRFRQVAFLPLEPGKIIRNGSLKVIKQLAMGGLSAIYLCQLDNREMVILKEAVIPDDSQPELKQKASELFEREARILMKLSNPGIVSVLDYFVDSGRSYLMLEYVIGQDLRQYVSQNGRVRESIVIDWALQVADTLSYLHKQETPVIHRDLTPDNLVVRNDGKIVVIDFGAANEFIGTSTGTFVGKQCYIAPEQFRGKATLQSDIYSFGGTLHFLLTGKDPEALTRSHPRELNSQVSEALDSLVADCTAPEAEERIKDVTNLKDRLFSFQAPATQP